MVSLSLQSRDMKTVVTEFVKFSYNNNLMDMYTTRGNVQAKVYKTLGDIDDVNIYINYNWSS